MVSVFDRFSWLRSVATGLNLRRSLWVAFGGAIALLVVFANAPAHAYDVQISPSNPEQGDTISVVIQAAPGATTPTVTAAGETYPAFAVGNNRYRAFVPTSPITRPGSMTIQVSGDETRNLAVGIRNRNFPTQRITLAPGRAGLQGTDYEFDRMDQLRDLVTPEKFWSGPMRRPSNGAITSIYGIQRYYNGVFAENYYHRGVDYAAPTGSPIFAPAAGRVVLVGRVEDGFTLNGNTVGIDHGQGVSSVFIHLSRFDVQEGDMVQAGQVIGGIGSTGFATGPNVHWGLYVNGVSVDPVPWRFDGFD